MAEQRLSLEDAGKAFGITANAMRARAKKSPEKYRPETDNTGKIWVWIDPEKRPSKSAKLKPSTSKAEGFNAADLKLSIESAIEAFETAVETGVLEERIRGLETLLDEMRRERDGLKEDRDAWRAMAQRPWWRRLAG